MGEYENPDAYIAYILDTYSTMLLRLAWQHVGNQTDAEDIVQETMVRLMTHAPVFESKEHERAWLLRVTINLCKDYHKNVWNSRTEGITEDVRAPEQEEKDTEVLDAVMRLPEHYKNVIYLFYYEEWSIAEIARALKQKETTVGSWLHRARKLLKKQLEGGVESVG